jgi:HEPN domain-containing protein
MNKEEKIEYWVKSSRRDWKVANHLFEKGDCAYALFFGHLTIEKLLKGIFVEKFDEVPPYTHRLVFLAEKVELDMSSDRLNCSRSSRISTLKRGIRTNNFLFSRSAPGSSQRSILGELED